MDVVAPIPSSSTNNTSSMSRTPQQQAQIDKHWSAITRLVAMQLGCSLLMQLSYVAFPAYNFALALWCIVCCTPKWVAKNPRVVLLQQFGVAFSIVTDIVWVSLWVSGRVFFDQFCNQDSVSIVSCGGPTDHFPGCHTNRFALFALIVNDFAKVAMLVAVARVRALEAANVGSNSSDHEHHHHGHHHSHHHSAHNHHHHIHHQHGAMTDTKASAPPVDFKLQSP